MKDFEKNRSEYVTHLETQLKHLQRQLQELKDEAHWIPEVGLQMVPEGARITLVFAGKRVTTEVQLQTLQQSSQTDITTAVIDSFVDNLIRDRFRNLVEEQVAKAQASTKHIANAGKW